MSYIDLTFTTISRYCLCYRCVLSRAFECYLSCSAAMMCSGDNQCCDRRPFLHCDSDKTGTYFTCCFACAVRGHVSQWRVVGVSYPYILMPGSVFQLPSSARCAARSTSRATRCSSTRGSTRAARCARCAV